MILNLFVIKGVQVCYLLVLPCAENVH
jgi:hypothetical protein